MGTLWRWAGPLRSAGTCCWGDARVRASVPTLPYITIVYAVAAVALLVGAIGSGQQMLGLPAESYFWMAMAALVPQVIGHSLMNWALGYWPAVNVSLAVRAEPVLATLVAIPVLGEIPPWTAVPGGAPCCCLASTWRSAATQTGTARGGLIHWQPLVAPDDVDVDDVQPVVLAVSDG